MELKRGVVFAGENPLITLYEPGSDRLTAAASYWRCAHSEQGEGNVLVIWVDPATSGRGERAPFGIYADNMALADMVWTNFSQHFEPFQNRGIEDLAPHPARFVQQADGRRLHRVACSANTTTIELVWQDVLDIFHTVTTPTVGGRDWEVANVIGPCARASIVVDGEPVIGEVRQPEGLFRSSAFLAFCETWISR